jgi:hypothetical protein
MGPLGFSRGLEPIIVCRHDLIYPVYLIISDMKRRLEMRGFNGGGQSLRPLTNETVITYHFMHFTLVSNISEKTGTC